MFDLQVTRSDKAWRKWFDTDAPEEEHMPDGYHTTLDSLPVSQTLQNGLGFVVHNTTFINISVI
jgi:hypothetical protein